MISLASVYGWKAWRGHQAEQAQISSGIYQELLDLTLSQPGQPMDDQQKATFDHLLSTLKEDHNGTVYTQFAALLKASKAVQNEDLNAAKEQLEWILLQKPAHDIAVITRLRLARVLLAQPVDVEKSATEALELLNQIDQPGAFKASYEDVRGDVLLAQGRRNEARQAYQLAVDVAAENGEARPLVTLKLDDLAKSGENNE